MVITGILLFYAIPIRSYQNIFFRLKLIALVLAGLNAWTFHTGINRRIRRLGGGAGSAQTRARMAGCGLARALGHRRRVRDG